MLLVVHGTSGGDATLGASPAASGSAAGPDGPPGRVPADAQDGRGGSSGPSGRAGAREEDRPRETGRPASPSASSASPGMVAGASASPGSGGVFSAHTDPQAAEFFRTTWGSRDKALKRLRDIRTVGGYLRIYTDLPDSADNSTAAIMLCERGLHYLRSRGVADPVVFVHAKAGGNGNPVLANILGPADRTCRVTRPDPG
ncbi:hypothetical protein C1J01_03725 [Nonomuraea aridisoli]|uniref:Uncharacterized protein n=1 Tax=Nonomuraea aridisoli TaxID=2070368 RepID=A0A2W2EJK6_9ACTN|nr:hypothetical protein C1J01_03725 [Nonomuraea aridisoli]